VVVFAHHRDVIQTLDERLGRFHPVQVIGGMTPLAKQRQSTNSRPIRRPVFLLVTFVPRELESRSPQRHIASSPSCHGFPLRSARPKIGSTGSEQKIMCSFNTW